MRPAVMTTWFVIYCSVVLVKEASGLVGGQEAAPGELPWAVYLSARLGRHMGRQQYAGCTGTLLGPRVVLTAAHCVEAAQDELPPPFAKSIQLVAGVAHSEAGAEAGRQERVAAASLLVERVTARELGAHDLALLVTDRPFHLNARLSPLPVANHPLSDQGAWCTAAGFGSAHFGISELLQQPGLAGLSGLARPVRSSTRTSRDPAPPSAPSILPQGPQGPQGVGGQQHSGHSLTRLHVMAYPCAKLNYSFKSDVDLICIDAGPGQGLCVGDSGAALVCNGHIQGVAHVIASTSEEQEEYPREYPLVHPQLRCGDGLRVASVYFPTFPSAGWIRTNAALLESKVLAAAAGAAATWALSGLLLPLLSALRHYLSA